MKNRSSISGSIAQKIMWAILIALLGTSQLWADSRMIRDFDYKDYARKIWRTSYWFERGNVQLGEAMYGDENRTLPLDKVVNSPAPYTIKSLPAYLLGSDWIQAPYDCRRFTGDILLEFKMNGAGDVYVAHDDKIKKKPDWLVDWTDSEEDLISSHDRTFSLYKKSFSKDALVVLGNNGSEKKDMYMVLVKGAGTLPAYPAISGTVYDVVKYGAVNDGTTVNTVAIQKAIDTCSAIGGGSVYIGGAGIYMTGTLLMKDNVTLHVEAGTILRGTRDKKNDYPQMICQLKFQKDNEHYQLIYAEQKKNIGIMGGGIICGNDIGRVDPWVGQTDLRARIIRFLECTNVDVTNITFTRATSWTQLYIACDEVHLDDVHTRCYTGQRNQDGVDIDSCNNVLIENSSFLCGDDGVCLKAMSFRDGSNVTIQNCIIRPNNGSGFKIGTETSGSWSNVVIRDCSVEARMSAIAVQCVDGATIEDILVENIDVPYSGSPLFVRLGDRGRTVKGGPEDPPVGKMRNITIRNVKAVHTGRTYGCVFTGIPGHYIENLTLENIDIKMLGSVTGSKASEVTVYEQPADYPKLSMFKRAVNPDGSGARGNGNSIDLPAYGIFARHIKNLVYKNVHVHYAEIDVRPGYIFDDVPTYTLNNVTAESNADTSPYVRWHKQNGELTETSSSTKK